jgi:hypothetical protein
MDQYRRPGWAKNERPYLKNKLKARGLGCVAQVSSHCKCEALRFNPQDHSPKLMDQYTKQIGCPNLDDEDRKNRI